MASDTWYRLQHIALAQCEKPEVKLGKETFWFLKSKEVDKITEGKYLQEWTWNNKDKRAKREKGSNFSSFLSS